MSEQSLKHRLFARAEPLQTSRTHIVVWALLAFIATFCVWASWAEIEEQVRAPGTVIVSSRSQVIQAVDGGVLEVLHVREGDRVEAGQLLAELDPERFRASSLETTAKFVALKATIERLTAELDGRAPEFSDDVMRYPGVVASMLELHQRRQQRQREELATLVKSLSLAREEMEALENLAATGDASTSEVLRMRRQVSELDGEISNRENTFRQEAQAELSAARSELEQVEQILVQREGALSATKLYAPLSGTVNSIRTTTIGAVLKSGDELMQIVPSDDPLLIEAKVTPKDVAFLRPDLPANIKLDPYDYTVYGSLRGRVTYISSDTLEEDTPRGKATYYRVQVQVNELPAEGRASEIETLPGMTGTVEIITGNRTVAQYLLKPLRRISAEALVER